MGSSENFADAIAHLSNRFCCIAVDLPGHGKTRIDGEDNTMSDTARKLIDLLDRLKIDKCAIVGYSMGGRLALYLLLHFPDRFHKGILESASPGLETEEARSQRRQADEQLAQQLKTGDFQSFLLNWYSQPLFQSLRDRPDFDRLIQQRLQNDPQQLAQSLRQMGTGNQPSLWEKLAENRIPLLLLVGEWDDKFKSVNAKMAKLCPVAELEIVPHSGHTIYWENLSEYVNRVRTFLCQNL